jgi:hypothetical protein
VLNNKNKSFVKEKQESANLFKKKTVANDSYEFNGGNGGGLYTEMLEGKFKERFGIGSLENMTGKDSSNVNSNVNSAGI